MSIITISTRSYCRGEEIAEKVARKLRYRCLSKETIKVASILSHIPEKNLVQAFDDAPSIMERFTYEREKYITQIQSALVRLVKKDNIIYHGFAGHFLLRNIPMVLKVGISASIEDRIALRMESDGQSRKEARERLIHDDEERRRWGKYLYGIDTWDTKLFDLAIHIQKITVEGAVEVICKVAATKQFQITAESQRKMDDLLVACDVKDRLLDLKPDINVTADNGVIFIQTKLNPFQEQDLLNRIKEIALNVPSVNDVIFDVDRLSPDVW